MKIVMIKCQLYTMSEAGLWENFVRAYARKKSVFEIDESSSWTRGDGDSENERTAGIVV